MTPNPAERTDFGELKEILKEMLHQLDFAYNYRLQKLVFYGDVWCLQNFGKRLTDASFKPYNYGSYSDDVAAALDELVEEEEVEYDRVVKSDGPTREYQSHPEGGELSSAKKRDNQANTGRDRRAIDRGNRPVFQADVAVQQHRRRRVDGLRVLRRERSSVRARSRGTLRAGRRSAQR